MVPASCQGGWLRVCVSLSLSSVVPGSFSISQERCSHRLIEKGINGLTGNLRRVSTRNNGLSCLD